jgi:hypothetical protein
MAFSKNAIGFQLYAPVIRPGTNLSLTSAAKM